MATTTRTTHTTDSALGTRHSALGRIGRFFRRYGWGYAFVLPSLLTFSLFTLVPMVWAILISFQNFRLNAPATWVGFDNYTAAFTTQSGVFVQALRNTALYTLFTVTTNVVVGLVLASLIAPLGRRAQTFFRAAFYLPAVTSAVIIAMVWRWLYNAQWGFFNFLLGLVGIAPMRWLNDPDIALTSITLSTMLTIPATAVVLFSAAIGAVPKELYEAAELDGASRLRRWWRITVPLIKPTTLYLSVLYTIGSFEVFDKVYIMVPSGVGNSTQVLVTQIYQNGFQQFRYGIAAAQGVILFLLILIVAVVQFRALRSDVEY